MTQATVKDEILSLEERLREAELGPDPEFFQEYIDDKMVMVAQGESAFPKSKIVEAHRAEAGIKFTSVEMSDMQIIEHGNAAAIVTCEGTYEGTADTQHLRFMRVWVKKPNGWRIVAITVS